MKPQKKRVAYLVFFLLLFLALFCNSTAHSAWDNGRYQTSGNALTLRSGDLIFPPLCIGILDSFEVGFAPLYLYLGSEAARLYNYGWLFKAKLLDRRSFVFSVGLYSLHLEEIFNVDAVTVSGAFQVNSLRSIFSIQSWENSFVSGFTYITQSGFLFSLLPYVKYFESQAFSDPSREKVVEQKLAELWIPTTEELAYGISGQAEFYWGKNRVNLIRFRAKVQEMDGLNYEISLGFARAGHFFRGECGLIYNSKVGFRFYPSFWVHTKVW